MLKKVFKQLKQKAYFLLAAYFKFWAEWRLRQWQPYIIVVTGSSGKTTLLHVLEAQLGTHARYSHLANSAFGIPFHILGLQRTTFERSEWLWLILRAPLQVWAPLPTEKLYVVEADCDRPGEGAFSADLLRPQVTLWLNASRTHTQNFDSLVQNHQFSSIEAAIAHEFGHFVALTQRVVYLNGDEELLRQQAGRTQAKVLMLTKAQAVTDYRLTDTGTTFIIGGQTHTLTGMWLPQAVWLSLAMTVELCHQLNLPYDFNYTHLVLPPGRSSVFRGLNHAILVDSTYNSNYDSMRVMLELMAAVQRPKKWLVLGDMIDLGAEEAEEHAKLGQLLQHQEYERVILVGPRLSAHTLPLLDAASAVNFLQPKDALTYLQQHLNGGETILFKGSRFLEGILEALLDDPADAAKLCRREPIWQRRRRQWGL